MDQVVLVVIGIVRLLSISNAQTLNVNGRRFPDDIIRVHVLCVSSATATHTHTTLGWRTQSQKA